MKLDLKENTGPHTTKAIEECFKLLIVNEGRQAIKYLTPKFVVKVTRVLHRKRPKSKRGCKLKPRPSQKIRNNVTRHNFVVTLGEPGYLERKEIKKFQKEGFKFPIKGVQIKPLIQAKRK